VDGKKHGEICVKNTIFKLPPRFTSDMIRQFAEGLASIRSDQTLLIPNDVEVEFLEPKKIEKHECPYCRAPINVMSITCDYCGGYY